MVPMLGSLGCPYTCAFCIDASVPYSRWILKHSAKTLRFLRPGSNGLCAWHEPKLGVRFDNYLDMIEDAVPPGSIDFVAESSLSLAFRTAPETAQA